MILRIEPAIFDIYHALQQQNYQFCSFEDDSWHDERRPKVVLRHDVDFDCEVALQMAKQEAEQGIVSTYYFLLRSDAYNLLSQKNSQRVLAIKALGHHISLHFDPVGYSDPRQGLQSEMQQFTAQFDYAPKVISIHRPSKNFFAEPESSLGVGHTYMQRYTQGFSYCSDSGGSFKYGHPLQSEAFQKRQDLHLLIHPLWWLDINCLTIEKMEWLREKKHADMEQLMAENCIPYAQHLHSQSRIVND